MRQKLNEKNKDFFRLQYWKYKIITAGNMAIQWEKSLYCKANEMNVVNILRLTQFNILRIEKAKKRRRKKNCEQNQMKSV